MFIGQRNWPWEKHDLELLNKCMDKIRDSTLRSAVRGRVAAKQSLENNNLITRPRNCSILPLGTNLSQASKRKCSWREWAAMERDF